MSKRFREARQLKKMKLIEAAKLLEVSQPTLSSWEGGRKSPGLDNLCRMADLYEVTTDYLLGRESDFIIKAVTPIPKQALPVLHGNPIWMPEIGWGLVNAIDNLILLASGDHLRFDEVNNLMLAAERFAESAFPHGTILSQENLTSYEKIWVEPISKDPLLREELRGWYHIKGRFAENDLGNRFTLDSYGSKWLAFETF